MSFSFVCDRIVQSKPYPAFAVWQADPYTPEWQQFVQHWPYTVPCELIEHCNVHGFPYQLHTIDDYPDKSYYIVGVGFFDFTIDYFALMNEQVIDGLKNNRLKILFYYHEGDNPIVIKERLDTLCQAHELSTNCYFFVSGNHAACRTPGAMYFPDHELLYWSRNQNVAPAPIPHGPRNRDFTVLSRTHKWWRATAITDLHRNGLLDNSYWSYRTDVTIDEPEYLNPIQVDNLNIRYAIHEFLKGTPYTCDNLTQEDHNNHALVETEHYTDSYCSIILETLYDTGIQYGSFLTEKTFKAIKHGHPFIMVGVAGSLQLLRDLGYRTFDDVIDTRYDNELDNTERWSKIFREIVRIKEHPNKVEWFNRCRKDIEHNRQLFLNSKWEQLNTMSKAFNYQYTYD